jgi:beta-mannosidase
LRSVAKFAALQELPTWNKTVLDTSIKRALERADPTRPVIAHSGVFPHVGSGGTDTHWYFGWYHSDERDFPAMCAAMPRLVRFVTEFGAQAVPENASFLEPKRWPDLDWPRLARAHALQREVFDRYVPPAQHETLDSWRRATQEYQARVIRFHIETLRRLKYRPTGGFCQFSFADGQPGVTWSVLDHERAPKEGYHALAAACAPVIVVASRPAVSYPPAHPVAWDIHVVSDLRSPISGVVSAEVRWEGGTRTWAWEGSAPADECTFIGAIRWETPGLPGPISVVLSLTGSGLDVTNRYETRVEP